MLKTALVAGPVIIGTLSTGLGSAAIAPGGGLQAAL